jgi:hypothetical protein
LALRSEGHVTSLKASGISTLRLGHRSSFLQLQVLGKSALPGGAHELSSSANAPRSRAPRSRAPRSRATLTSAKQPASPDEAPFAQGHSGSARKSSRRQSRCQVSTPTVPASNGALQKGPAESSIDTVKGADEAKGNLVKEAPKAAKKFQSSWDAKDVTGRTYIENLGKESANMNIVVGAKEGMIDSVFVGDFLGKEGGHLATFFSGG